MITTEDYILYGFLAFIALLLVTIVVAMFRQSHDIGELRGQNEGIQRQLTELSARVAGLEQTAASQAAAIGEVKGILLALHRQMGLLLRHRHDADTGQVALLPEAVAAAD